MLCESSTGRDRQKVFPVSFLLKELWRERHLSHGQEERFNLLFATSKLHLPLFSWNYSGSNRSVGSVGGHPGAEQCEWIHGGWQQKIGLWRVTLCYLPTNTGLCHGNNDVGSC